MITENLKAVKSNISQAALRAGRDPSEVLLVAVSKTKPNEMVMEAYDAGQLDFGENKVQELVRKYGELPGDIRWHFIGNLQRNKVRMLTGKPVLIHSVSSVRLAETVGAEAVRAGITADILLEVNVAGEESKGGFSLAELEEAMPELLKIDGIRIRGLMTVAPYVPDPEANREVFRTLREERGKLNASFPGLDMTELSMGMSNDYVIAVEEGATFVRVGSDIFGARDYSQN